MNIEERRWRVYWCPRCGELNLYAGLCDNISKHPGELVGLQVVTVVPERSRDDEVVEPLDATGLDGGARA